MGLDITAYRQISKIDIPADADEYEHDAFRVWVNSDFPGRADDLEHKAAYVAADAFGFRAGSYSGYNDWRERLAMIAGYPAVGHDARHAHSQGAWAADSGPFWELINFADNEGTIGPAVAGKLAKDFAEWQPKVDKLASDFENDWFKGRYANWRKAFELAADAGCVDFH